MKTTKKQVQGTMRIDYSIRTWVQAFLFDRQAQNLSDGTLKFYGDKLRKFTTYLAGKKIHNVLDIQSAHIRAYLLDLESEGHKPGGVHAHFRSVRVWLRWFEFENELDDWSNPIKKIKAPRVPLEPLEPASLDDIQRLLKTCVGDDRWTNRRDGAIFLGLLDTGARANEFLSLDVDDVNLATGEAVIRNGKGRKPRTVFFGKRAIRALRAYVRTRTDNEPFLWLDKDGGRLGYDGLRAMINRRAFEARIKTPSIHSFRRAFAINMLRAGVDLITLSGLMGHSSLDVLQRYLKQETSDFAAAHRRASPGDSLNK